MFATKFCNLYLQNYNDFSQEGQRWIDAVRKCLQVSLVQTLRPYLRLTCKDVKQLAFDSHTPCYVHPVPESPSISVCNLGASDFFSVFWTIKSSLRMSADSSRRTIRGMFGILKTCPGSFLKKFNFDGTVRLLKLRLKYFRRLTMRTLNDFVNSIAKKLRWQETGIIWFADPEINSTTSASSETYMNIYLTDRNVYDLNADNTTVPSNLNTTVNEFKKMTKTGDLNGFSITILSSQGCLDANCDKLSFNITARNKGVRGDGSMCLLNLMIVVVDTSPQRFRRKSGYKLKHANNTIENYLFATKLELSKLKMNKIRDNLSKKERIALNNLRANKNIIIKKADKNSSTVVLDKKLYIKQAMVILNNNIHYEQIQECHTEDISETINGC
ncbi:unnamed protein product [Mytilus coruscus]|uniref:Uncharacterized protein n=1 Tax=Mytilus coruscus TaxID=42192 RepID=A0A6J8D2N1_MYTCO|nr:unnamed protein product [Mytilus coruscus]